MERCGLWGRFLLNWIAAISLIYEGRRRRKYPVSSIDEGLNVWNVRCLSDLKGYVRRAHRGDFIFHSCVLPGSYLGGQGRKFWLEVLIGPDYFRLWCEESWHKQAISLVNAWAVMQDTLSSFSSRHDVSPPIYLPAALLVSSGDVGLWREGYPILMVQRRDPRTTHFSVGHSPSKIISR